jgi:quercetin dioxygenase-like cupin family protein
MAVTFNQVTVASENLKRGIARQALLSEQRVPNINFQVDRLAIDAGASHELSITPTALAWFQVLGGGGELVHGGVRQPITDSFVGFLPPGFKGQFESRSGMLILLVSLQDAQRFDPDFGAKPLSARIVDWTTEPVLLSEHDARKRIYLITPKLFATKAIKGEMIIYPPGTEASKHHHEGAAHFMYILAGKGTCFANDEPFQVQQGDVIYYHDGESHYLRSDPVTEMRFVEFFVPGEYKTVWAPGASVCTWNPAGSDILGRKAAREIQAHSSAAPTGDI